MTCYPLKLCEDGAVSWSKQCVSLFIAALNNIILCHRAWMFPLEQKRTQAGFISFKTAVPCISLRYMISVDFFFPPPLCIMAPRMILESRTALQQEKQKCAVSAEQITFLDADSRSFQGMQHHGCKCICWEKELGICCISQLCMGLMRSISRVCWKAQLGALWSQV